MRVARFYAPGDLRIDTVSSGEASKVTIEP